MGSLAELVNKRIAVLRPRLLDTTRRNPLVNNVMTARTAAFVRIVDEKPQSVIDILGNDTTMRLQPLPPLDNEPPDELTQEFITAFENAQTTDDKYIAALDKLDFEGDESVSDKQSQLDRELKDRIRELLELPPRPASAQHFELINHAKIHGINPSFMLPAPDVTSEDERFDDAALQTLLLPATLQSRLGRMYSKVQMYREERGLDVVFLAIGYLDWCMPDADPQKESFKSPIALIPVIFDRKRSSEGEVYTVRQQAGVHFNPVLGHKLKHDAKLEIDEILEAFEGDSIDIEAVFDLIASKKPKRMKWGVKRQATFGLYPFQGIDQYFDLRTDDIDFSEFPVLKELMLGRETGSGDGCGFTEDDTESQEAIQAVPHLVLDADSSQFLALLKVASGESVALEGPPGSGKSQTIVNAIANAIEAGKRVLFVAQKATALDVVYARLQALGLENFVLPMVGAKSDSDEFYESLDQRMAVQSARKPGDENSIRRQLQGHRDTLSDYIDLITSRVAGTQITVHQLYGLCVEHHDALIALPIEFKTLSLSLAKYSESFGVKEFRAACKDIKEWGDQFVELDIPEASPWSTADLLQIDYGKISEVNSRGVLALQELERQLSNADSQVAANFLTLLAESTLDEITTARKLGQRWANQTTVSWREMLMDRKDALRALREFDSLGGELEAVCRANNQSFADALRHASEAEPLTLYSELLRRLKAEDVSALSLPNVITEIDNDLTRLHQVSEKRQLMERLKVDLSPGDVLEALASRKKLFAHNWFSDVAEQSTLSEIRNDLKSGQDALKAAYSLVDDKQSLPTVREVQKTLRIIESAGLFARWMKPYKTARQAAADWLGLELGGLDRESLTADLSQLLAASEIWEATAPAEHLPAPDANTRKLLGATQQNLNEYMSLLSGMGLAGSQISVLLTTPLLDDIATLLAELNETTVTWAQIDDSKADKGALLSWIREREELLRRAHALCREEDVTEVEAVHELATATSAARERQGELTRLAESLGLPDIAVARGLLPSLIELVLSVSGSSELLIETVLLSSNSPVCVLFDTTVNETAKVESLAKTLAIGKADDAEFSTFADARLYLGRHLQDLEGFNRLVQRRGIVSTAESFGLGGIVTLLEKEARLEEAWSLGPAALAYYLRSRAEAEFGSRMLNFSGTSLKSAREKLQQTDRKLIELAPRSVTSATLAQANPPEGIGHGRKSEYTEMALLRHELQKKRRIPPRKLLKRANGALAALFPCWMMVPGAVAQHLPREELFDLVIIDEASQMTPETAISALMRASQAMICGDTNQLPPTNFFKGLSGDEEEDEDLTTDDESVLELANTQFHPKHRLRWHYRSRHEELISFSNHYVYDDDLVIFPSPGGTGDQMGVSLVQVNGTFSRGLNPAEAQVMADHIVQFMRDNPHRSLGAVVMNQSQKEHLDAQVLRMAEQDSAVADYIDAWAEKDGGLEKFFVKNLENVQGDERDVIFVGTVYGRDSQGKFYQRFGPLNGASGKRRLNVLFSRAKEQIVTFSSIPMELFNPADTNEGARLLKLWLQFSQSKRLGERIVSDVERGLPDSPFEEHVIAAVESLGFEAVPQVGVSNYYIDIGVKHPDYPFGYLCGVECDGATYHSSKNARDRDRLREEVLLRLGWGLYRIWSTDWFRDPFGERQNLENYLQACLRDKVAGMPEVVESPITTIEEEMLYHEEEPALTVTQAQEARHLFSETDQQEAVSDDADTIERIGPIVIGSRVRVRYLDGARAGVETKFWLTDLSEDQYAEMPGYMALRPKAPIFKSIIGGYEGDLVSYDFQDTEIGVEILEVIT